MDEERSAAAASIEDGDVPIEVNAARAALSNRNFRVVWLGALASSIGSWMQSFTLGAFAFQLTHSATFVGIVAFAQFGPALVLSLLAGTLADTFDRRRLCIVLQIEQLVASAILAIVVLHPHPHRVTLLLPVIAGGIGGVLTGPAFGALLPSMVDRRHLAGAVSLSLTQQNASRVIGPAIGGMIYPVFGAAAVFGINAASFLFAIGALLSVPSPPFERAPRRSGLHHIAEGIRTARDTPVVRRVLVTIAVFSLLCLPFANHMPTFAAEALGVRVKSVQYGLLYATYGVGTVIGAVGVGTFLSRWDLRRVIRLGLTSFGVLLFVLASLSSAPPAFPILLVFGFVYIATVTALSTRLLENVDDAVRGRVFALWQLCFVGAGPLGGLIAGPIAEAVSIRFVLAYGAASALALSLYAGR